MIFHSHFLFCFHFREQREISIYFAFHREFGCLFKQMKHLSKVLAFSSSSSFLNKFFGKGNGCYRTCNIRTKKVDPSNGKFDIGTGSKL